MHEEFTREPPKHICPCKDCGKDVRNPKDMYMLEDNLWKQLGLKPGDFLCIDCLEKRLGREITQDDLKVLPINYFNTWLVENRYKDLLTPYSIAILQDASALFDLLIKNRHEVRKKAFEQCEHCLKRNTCNHIGVSKCVDAAK